ncbi:MAG: hypothetical protein ACLPXZ_22735 [Mycobacterium sp.]
MVYPDHAGLTRPDSVNAHKIVAYTYGGNGWSKNLGASRPPDTVVGDLGKFDIQAVMGALHAAPQTLHMDGGKVENMIIEAANDGTLRLEIYVSDGHAEHYLMVNADGTVRPDF